MGAAGGGAGQGRSEAGCREVGGCTCHRRRSSTGAARSPTARVHVRSEESLAQREDSKGGGRTQSTAALQGGAASSGAFRG